MSSSRFEHLIRLIQGCQKGDRNSQKLLYTNYYGYGMSIALRYCRNQEEALEALNDAFMKVFNGGIQRYEYGDNLHEGYFKSWLKRIIIHTALDYYRKNQKLYYHENIEDINAESIYFIEPQILDRLSYEEILNVVKTLSPMYYAVFCLHVIDGFTHEEIAEKLNISEGTSKSNLAKARMRLKEMIKKKDKEEYAGYIG